MSRGVLSEKFDQGLDSEAFRNALAIQTGVTGYWAAIT
jgi:hypothetical protein